MTDVECFTFNVIWVDPIKYLFLGLVKLFKTTSFLVNTGSGKGEDQWHCEHIPCWLRC